MKKIISLLMAAAMAFVLCACGNNTDQSEPWSRTGSFIDDDGNYVMITEAEEDDENEGWFVNLIAGEDFYGAYIPQEGDTLHGDIRFNEDDDPFVVTVSEEGDDGILLETESGETYHMVPGEYEPPEGTFTVKINSEGFGHISYAPEGEELVFDEDQPYDSSVINLQEPAKYTLGAKAEDGWKFVKWTKDGEDLSEEETITVELTEDVEYIACFEPAEEDS